jgi:hypothetical protein
MKTRKIFYSSSARKLFALLSKGDILIRNNGRSMVWLLKRAIEPLVVRWNGSLVAGLVSFSRDCSAIARLSGIKYLVTYLKGCQVLLQQSIGGHKIVSTRPLKAAIGRTKSGIPTMIPSSHRIYIRMKRRQHIRIWMTLFGLYRVLEFPGSLNIKTITAPGKMLSGDLIVEFREFILNVFWPSFKWATFNKLAVQANSRNKRGKIDLWTPFVKDLKSAPFVLRKSSPSTEKMEIGDILRDISTSPAALKKAAAAWVQGVGKVKVFGPYSLWDLAQDWIKHSNSKWLLDMILGLSQDYMKEFKRPPSICLGKLGQKEEPAGKIRVFAMVDAFTQWMFEPLHRHLFGILRLIKQDGTFDQHRPVKDLLSRPHVKGLWSFDLSAATDRLPIKLQEIVLMPVLGLHGAAAWSALLTLREYSLKGAGKVKYAVGQPMGALSSWAMLALTHHALVQWAWYRLCTRMGIEYRWFKDYAVLGDDIINSALSAEYLHIMDQIGVEIGLAKSLVSPNKLVGEFAKRFYIPSDASMVPFKESIAAWFNGNEFAEYCRKYNVSISQALRSLGFGHKALAVNKLFKSCPRRLRNSLLLMSSPMSHLGFDWSQFFHLKGWKMLASSNSRKMLQSLRDSMFASVERQLLAAKPLKDWAWELKMLPRAIKLGLDHAEFTPLTGYTHNWIRLHSLLSSEIDDFAYQYEQLVARHKEMPTMPLEWKSFESWLELQQAVSALGKEKSLIVAKLRDDVSPSVHISKVKVVSTYWKVVRSPTESPGK